MKHLICSQSEFKVVFSLIKKAFLKDLNEGCLVYWFTSWEQAASGLCLEAASGKHPTPYCVQIMIHPIARFRWQTEGGERALPSHSLWLKCPRNSCEWDPNYHLFTPFKQRSVSHISSREENILILMWRSDAVSRSPSWLLRGRDQREWRLLGETLILSHLWLEWRLRGNLYSRGDWGSLLVCSVVATEGDQTEGWKGYMW